MLRIAGAPEHDVLLSTMNNQVKRVHTGKVITRCVTKVRRCKQSSSNGRLDAHAPQLTPN